MCPCFVFKLNRLSLGGCTFCYHLKILINWPWKDCHHPQQNLNSIEGNDLKTTRILAKFQEECKNVFLAWKSISFHIYLDIVQRTTQGILSAMPLQDMDDHNFLFFIAFTNVLFFYYPSHSLFCYSFTQAHKESLAFYPLSSNVP